MRTRLAILRSKLSRITKNPWLITSVQESIGQKENNDPEGESGNQPEES